MKFFSLQSGSNGNSHFIKSNNAGILIDSGLSGVKTKKLLEESGFSIEDVDGLIITHEHIDHISGVGVLARMFKIPVYANRETMFVTINKVNSFDASLMHFIDEPFMIGDMKITPFPVSHDAVYPFGYLVESEGKKISFVTDTGVISDYVYELTENSDLYFVESNFDPIMLKNGPYTKDLQRRVAGEFGHLSNFECAHYLINSMGNRTKAVVIGHISYQNNNEILAKLTVENILAENGFEVPVYVSGRFNKSEVISI